MLLTKKCIDFLLISFIHSYSIEHCRSAGNGDAIEVCNEEEGTPCSQYKELGFECVPVWNCRNNIIITDGSVRDALKKRMRLFPTNIRDGSLH